jgi:hypothetical protein
LSSAEKCRLVARRMSLTVFSALCGACLSRCLIVSLRGVTMGSKQSPKQSAQSVRQILTGAGFQLMIVSFERGFRWDAGLHGRSNCQLCVNEMALEPASRMPALPTRRREYLNGAEALTSGHTLGLLVMLGEELPAAGFSTGASAAPSCQCRARRARTPTA